MIAAFRKHFKPGLVEVEYGDIYGRVMKDRHVSDYDIDLPIDPQVAEDDLRDALRFEESGHWQITTFGTRTQINADFR